MILIPLFKKANWRILSFKIWYSKIVVSVKISSSGLNLTCVPVSVVSPKIVGFTVVLPPFSNLTKVILPSLYTVTSKYLLNALTTEAPTPWRPPLTL